MGEGSSLAETPSYAVAIVITAMVALGSFCQCCLEWAGKWLEKTKRRSLVVALEKIKDELMLFGLLSLLMGHWMVYFAKICIKSSASTSKFYPCVKENFEEDFISTSSKYINDSSFKEHLVFGRHSHCPEGEEPLVSYESLEQLHRLLFVLVVTHVSYNFAAIALAITKILSWRTWENQAKEITIKKFQGRQSSFHRMKTMTLTTFIFHHTSHPWTQHKVLVWLVCFSRQFWSSINHADYMSLRWGFVTTHELPPSYDFLNYMLRSMEEDFRDIVGISVPFWIYAILCIILDFHGTNIYFWLSFLPAILILLVGFKLHRVVIQLAVEARENSPSSGMRHFKLGDELFWFRKPRLLLWLVQSITFQNAFEMANFLWSLWEIEEASCFMDNDTFLVSRLVFGVASQFWCSFVTFPLYVIVTQMGSTFKCSVISEEVRISLKDWKKRALSRQSSLTSPLHASTTPSKYLLRKDDRTSYFSRSMFRRQTQTYAYTPTSKEQNYRTLEDLLSESPPFRHSSSYGYITEEEEEEDSDQYAADKTNIDSRLLPHGTWHL